MLNNNITGDLEVAECAQLLEASPPIPPSFTKAELSQDEVSPRLIGQKLPRYS